MVGSGWGVLYDHLIEYENLQFDNVLVSPESYEVKGYGHELDLLIIWY